MKWFTELSRYYQGGNKLSFEACLDTPIYMYNLQSRYTLKEHIKEFTKNNHGNILTEKELDLLCWEIDCLRESNKHFNGLGKEKVYFKLYNSWSFPTMKYIPSRSLILSSSIYAYDGNQRRDWLKRHEGDWETKTADEIKEEYKILAKFSSDKTLIKEIIEEILSYNMTKPVMGNYRFTLFINIYYTFCHGSRNT